MSDVKRDPRHALWDAFLAEWPITRLETMTVAEYTNTEKAGSFCYWLEARTENLGSIWGMNAFKFGIYERVDKAKKPNLNDRMYTDTYGWKGRFGKTPPAAFEQVRATVVRIAKAAAQGDFAAIDAISFTFMVKWKIAFLYQPRDACQVVPVFNESWLGKAYRRIIGPGKQPGSVMHAALSKQYQHLDVFERGELVLARLKEEKPVLRYWVLPVDPMFVEAVADAAELAASEVAESVLKQMRSKQVSVNDRIALAAGAEVIAVGEITEVDDDDVSWTQRPVRFTPRLFSLAGYELKEITDPDERKAIWDEAPKVDPTPEPYTGPSHNVLLYGPPGTGKTYATIARAIELCGEVLPAAETDRQATFRRLQDEGRVAFVTFHQSYGYEEFVEGLRPRVAAGSVAYEVLPGAFKRLCTDAARNPHLQHTVVVDEINRGNVSRILGELITLLEPDKRLGASHELVVTLPYSGETFGVPRNLHVLGTLNTADRSIALLDVALRRRFTFEEVMPDSRVIRDVLKARGVPAGVTQLASSLLDTLNQRIAWLYDREHQLGHAFFLGVGEGEDGKPAPERAVADLRGVFVERVFPLLQEYFYGDWAKVCLVLGCPYDDAGALRRKGVAMRPVVTATVHAAKGLFGTRLDDDEERKVTYAFDRDFVAGKLSDDDTLAMLRGVLAEQVPM